jgi:hypothetical protein
MSEAVAPDPEFAKAEPSDPVVGPSKPRPLGILGPGLLTCASDGPCRHGATHGERKVPHRGTAPHGAGRVPNKECGPASLRSRNYCGRFSRIGLLLDEIA